MSTLIHDPTLILPTFPSPIPRLFGPGGRTESAGPAQEGFFSLAGRRTLIWGDELEGVREIRVHPLRTLLNLDAGLGPATSVRLAPGFLRRDLMGPEGPVLERILAFRELPGAAIQWSRPTEAEGPLSLRLSFEVGPILPRGDRPPVIRYRERDSLLRIALAPGDPGALYFLNQPADGWEIEEVFVQDGTLLRVKTMVSCKRGESILLGLVGSPRAGEDVADTLSAFRFLGAQEGQWDGRGRGDPADPLLVDASDPRVAEGTDWAKARLDSALLHDSLQGAGVALGYGMGLGRPKEDIWWVRAGDPKPEALLAGLGALAAGRFALPSTILDGLAHGPAWAGPPPPNPFTAPLFLLLAGEFVRWSGGPGIMVAGKRSLDRAVAWCLDRPWESESESFRTLMGAGLESLARGAEAVGEDGWARDLRAGVGRGGALPSLDSSPLDAIARAAQPGLQGFFVGDSSDPEPALSAWAELRCGSPDQGWEIWMDRLAAGLEPPRGSWSASGPSWEAALPNHVSPPALLLGGILFGLLGADADAALGRLRLAPRIPGGMASLRVRNIRLGDAKISFFYQRRDEGHRFLIHQNAGRVPLNLVFMPEVSGSGLESVRLDGKEAELKEVRREGRTGASLQFPLDRERELVMAARDEE